jgi:hypothetical protein
MLNGSETEQNVKTWFCVTKNSWEQFLPFIGFSEEIDNKVFQYRNMAGYSLETF